MHARRSCTTHSLSVITPIAQVSHFSLYSLFCVISGAASKNIIAIENSKIDAEDCINVMIYIVRSSYGSTELGYSIG